MKSAIYYCLLTTLGLLTACQSGEDPWRQDRLDQRLLDAVYEADPAAIDSCLKAGASLTARATDGATPLLIAVSQTRPAIVQQLLKVGADPDQARNSYYRSTPLMEAAVRNDTLTGRHLLEAGADVTLRDSFGDPAINWAAYYGQVAYTQLLLEAGADWNVKSQHGTALDIATKEWQLDWCDFVMRAGAGVPDVDNQALALAARNGQTEKALALLARGHSPQTKDALGMPILSWAAAKRDMVLTQHLLEAGADPNATNRSGQTALAAAARFGHEALLRQLIKAGGRVNAADDRYRLTPLMAAAIGGHYDCMRILLSAGADVDAQDALIGFTPLMYAVGNGHQEVVALLIEARANPYIKGKDGTGLYDLLSLNRNQAIGDLVSAYLLERQ